MNLGETNKRRMVIKMKKTHLILVFLIVAIGASAQVDPLTLIAQSILQDMFETLFIHEKLSGMGIIGGNNYVNRVYNDAKNKIEAHFNDRLQRLVNKYEGLLKDVTDPNDLAGNKHVQEFNQKVDELHRTKVEGLQMISDQVAAIKETYTPYWQKNKETLEVY